MKLNARFNAPVHNVAGRDVNNTYYPTVPPPDLEHKGQATRECPQCRHITWAYNERCHHCQLDMKSFDRRKRWQNSKYVIWLLLAGMIGLAAKSIQAAPDVEIVRIDPKRPPPKTQPAPSKVALDSLLRELSALRSGTLKALQTRDGSDALYRRAGQLQRQASAIVGDRPMHDPFQSCLSAATWAFDTVVSARDVLRETKPDPVRVGQLITAATEQGDSYRQCKEQTNRLPG